MIKNTYSVEIATTATCPERDTVMALLDGLQNGETLKVKSVIGKEKVLNRYPVYLEKESQEKQYGFLKAVKSEKGTLDDLDVQVITESESYEILLTGMSGKNLIGSLNVLVDEGAAVQASSAELNSLLKTATEEAVNVGYVTKEEMDARMRVFKENAVDDYLILRIIQKYREYNKPVHKPSCIFQDPYLETSKKRKQEGIISEGLRAAASRNAVICEGEKSVGKNVYLETIAWLMGMPMYLITFSRQMSPSSIYGEKTTGATCSSTSL